MMDKQTNVKPMYSCVSFSQRNWWPALSEQTVSWSSYCAKQVETQTAVTPDICVCLCVFPAAYLLFIVVKHKDDADCSCSRALDLQCVSGWAQCPSALYGCSIVFSLWLMGLVHCHLAADRSHKSLPRNAGLLCSLCICTQYQPL